jgi:hypothetical protein
MLPLKPNGHIKNMGAHDRIPSEPASPGMKRPMKFAGGAFQNTTLNSSSWRHIGTLGPPCTDQ